MSGTPADPGDQVRLLVMELDDHRFALPALAVQRVVRAARIDALPKAPPIVEGAINVHGTVVPVLDVRQRFQLPAVPLHPDQHFVLAHAGSRMVALRVDRATDLVSVEREAIASGESAIPGVEYVAGIVTLPDGLLVIHDLDRFLALEEARMLETALRTPVSDAGPPTASSSDR